MAMKNEAPQDEGFDPLNHSPDAFAGFDSGVYLGWMKAVSDLMACGGQGLRACADETTPNLGGLLYSLSQAAEELAILESKEAAK